MDRFAPRPYRRTVAEQAVRGLLVEVPAWTGGLALMTGTYGLAGRVLGVLVFALAVGALIGSTFAVKRWAPWDAIVRSERRRVAFRRDRALAQAALGPDEGPDAAEAREDARAVLAEDDARKGLAGHSDAELHAAIRATALPDEAAARAVVEGRWGDALARSCEVRFAGVQDWSSIAVRLDEAWLREQARGG